MMFKIKIHRRVGLRVGHLLLCFLCLNISCLETQERAERESLVTTNDDESEKNERADDQESGEEMTPHRLRWDYSSLSIDFNASLITYESEDLCQTSGYLRVNHFLSSPSLYTFKDVTCEELKVTSRGDILLYQRATGHDWSTERLSVDRERDIFSLGPWRSPIDQVSYEYMIWIRPCRECECPQLHLKRDTEEDVLELPKICDQ